MVTGHLTWAAADGATGYRVDYKKSSDSSWTTFSSNQPGVTCDVTSLDENTDYDFRVYTLCASGNSSGTSITGELTPHYIFIEDTYTCEQDSVFTLQATLTGFSSPAVVYYDSTTGYLYVIDLDDSTSNVYVIDVSSVTTSGTYVGTSYQTYVGATSNAIYGYAVDPTYRRLYMCGKNTGGLIVYDIAANTFTTYAYGWDVSAHLGYGNGFNRLTLSLLDDRIIVMDVYSQTISVFDRATLAYILHDYPISSIPSGSSYITGSEFFSVNGETWVLVVEGSGLPNIARYDNTFTTLIGYVDLTAVRSTAFYSGQYWGSGFFDSYNNTFYVFDCGTNQLIVINTSGTPSVTTTVPFFNTGGKLHATFGLLFDPITQELFMSGSYLDSPSDSSPIQTSYKLDRLLYTVTYVYPGISFSSLERIGSTNILYGSYSGGLKWDTATNWGNNDTVTGTAWATDGQILKYSR